MTIGGSRTLASALQVVSRRCAGAANTAAVVGDCRAHADLSMKCFHERSAARAFASVTAGGGGSTSTRGRAAATKGAGVMTAGERVLDEYLRGNTEEQEMRDLQEILSRETKKIGVDENDLADAKGTRTTAVASGRVVRATIEDGAAVAIGRRKSSRAKVRLVPYPTSSLAASEAPGTGHAQPSMPPVTINGLPAIVYFNNNADSVGSALLPLLVTDTVTGFSVEATVRGGGTTGQSGAIRLAIARALDALRPDLHKALKHGGKSVAAGEDATRGSDVKLNLLTRDARVVERKKPGKPKARKSFQWVKR